MTDYFALLEEPRRPWLDSELLKQKFLRLSAQTHPDRAHAAGETERRAAQGNYTALNAAYNCLREHKERLRHLLELERGSKPVELQQIPDELMNLFFEVSRLCRDTDAFLEEKGRVTSPLLQVSMFERGEGWSEKLGALQRAINSKVEGLTSDLKRIDRGWEGPADLGARATTYARIEELYRLFGYYNRWSSQVQERIVQLAL
jgi:curved DNA-binding protein CbpA